MYSIIVIVLLKTILQLQMAYLSTKSAFFPLVGAALHCSHRFSAGMVSVVGQRPPKLAPGMSSSQSALRSALAMASFYLTTAAHSARAATAHARRLHDPRSPTKPISVEHMASLQLRAHALVYST